MVGRCPSFMHSNLVQQSGAGACSDEQLWGIESLLPSCALLTCVLFGACVPVQANRNWAALIDDFIDLEFLPKEANR